MNNYRISWPLGEAIMNTLRELPRLWRRRGLNDDFRFCRSDMWFISIILTSVVGGGLGSIISAFCSTSGHANDITLWNHTGLYPAFWIYLAGLTPVLFCSMVELTILTMPISRGVKKLGSMAMPRIERVPLPIDRSLIEKYERGELDETDH